MAKIAYQTPEHTICNSIARVPTLKKVSGPRAIDLT